MTKLQLSIGQAIVFLTGVGLAFYGWITHTPDASAIGIPMAVGAAAAFGIPRPTDV